MSSSIRYEESSRRDFVRVVRSRAEGGLVIVRTLRSRAKGKLVLVRDFVRPLQCHAEGEHVLIWMVRGIKQARLHPSGTKSREESLSTSVRYEVPRGELVYIRPVR